MNLVIFEQGWGMLPNRVEGVAVTGISHYLIETPDRETALMMEQLFFFPLNNTLKSRIKM